MSPLLLGSVTVAVILLIVGKYWHGARKLQLAEVFLERAETLQSEEKWSQAMTYLQRYLWIHPDDLDRRLQMIDVYERGIKTNRDRSRLSAMFYETLGMVPEHDPEKAPVRVDLRLRLAENLMSLGDYVRAEEQARNLARELQERSEVDSTEYAKAKRLIALSLYPRARDFVGFGQKKPKEGNPQEGALQQAEGVSVEDAASALADSLEDFPADVELASITANFYRKYRKHFERLGSSENFNPSNYADDVIERLLEKKGDDPDALVQVYLYRSRYIPANAEESLLKALELAPEHHQALLLNAVNIAQQAETPQDALNNAGESLNKAIEAQPLDSQGYVILARLMARAGDLNGSIKTLRQGKQRVGAGDFAIGHELVSRLFEAEEFTEAEQAIAELEVALRPKLPQLTTASRRETENLLGILQSKLAIHKGDLRSALVALKAIAAGTEQETSATVTTSGIESRKLLGLLTEKLGYWDLAASYWSSLTIDAPHLGEPFYRAGVAYLKIRQPGKAINYLDRYLDPINREDWTPRGEARLILLQAHLQVQTRRSSFSQNWAEFLATLKEVQQRLPSRWESVFAEADYLKAQATDQSRDKAYELLKATENNYSNDAVFWRSLVQAYSSLDKPDDATRALESFEQLESDPLQRGIMRANFFALREQYLEADELLASLVADASGENKQKIQTQRLRVFLAGKHTDKAASLLQELINERPDDPQLLSIGIEAMLTNGEIEKAEEWEKQLQSLNLPDDFLWRYFRARRYLSQYESLSKAKQNELGQLISSIRSSRPGWYNVIGLAARYAELRGDARQAIDNYELAIKLGDDSTEMLRRLVLLLNNQGRFTDADAYLNLLSNRQTGTLPVESLEISSAIRNNQIGEAVELARLAVDRHPDDPQRRIWLASLLSLDKQLETAEEVYRQALKEFPKDVRLWNGYFALLVKSEQTDKAAKVLETLARTVIAEPVKRHYALAQGYLQLDNRERASKECELALEKQPAHLESRLLYAKLLLNTDTSKAEEQLQKVLEQDQDHR